MMAAESKIAEGQRLERGRKVRVMDFESHLVRL
jgi:hypothetical protein